MVFRPGVNVGVDVAMSRLRSDFDAILLAGGAGQPRDLPVPGRELQGIHFAMEYLTLQNRRCEGDVIPDDQFISAKDSDVVIIGGGDTGADCLGTVHRQGARSVYQLELMPMPPEARAEGQSVAALAEDLPRRRPRTKKAASACFRCRRSGSSATRRAAFATLQANKVEMVRKDGRLEFVAGARDPSSRSRRISCCWRWASSAPSAGRCSTISA